MKQPAPFYYLDNFISLINSVYSLYDDLLTCKERHFYQRFNSLDTNSQALLVRLLSRKGDLFRAEKLKYSEISDIPLAVDNLLHCDFISKPLKVSVDELFPLFTKAEWLKVINNKELKKCKKDELRSYLPESEQLLPIILEANHENLIKLNCRRIFSTYILLFFGNGRQDLTDFITEDLGIYRYENYPIHKQSRFFENRPQVESMLQYYAMQEELYDLKAYDSQQLISMLSRLPNLQDVKSECYVEKALDRRVQSAHIQIARQLERLGAIELALPIYRCCDQPPSRERQVRILHKQQENDQLYQLCQEMLQAGSEAEKMLAKRFLVKLNQAEKESAKPYIPPSETLELAQSKHGVELSVVAHLSQNGACFYVENQLFLGLFGLVFWPAIFADVQGAFTHKFQYQPHDLFDGYFTHRRENEIVLGWQRLEKWSQQPELALDFFHQKQGISNPFVAWIEGFEEVLMLALQRIPINHLKRVFHRLWQNLKENSSGFPDLISFPKEGGYSLIEVKGPGDRLQNNQTHWLEYFAELGIPHKVAYVVWLE